MQNRLAIGMQAIKRILEKNKDIVLTPESIWELMQDDYLRCYKKLEKRKVYDLSVPPQLSLFASSASQSAQSISMGKELQSYCEALLTLYPESNLNIEGFNITDLIPFFINIDESNIKYFSMLANYNWYDPNNKNKLSHEDLLASSVLQKNFHHLVSFVEPKSIALLNKLYQYEEKQVNAARIKLDFLSAQEENPENQCRTLFAYATNIETSKSTRQFFAEMIIRIFKANPNIDLDLENTMQWTDINNRERGHLTDLYTIDMYGRLAEILPINFKQTLVDSFIKMIHLSEKDFFGDTRDFRGICAETLGVIISSLPRNQALYYSYVVLPQAIENAKHKFNSALLYSSWITSSEYMRSSVQCNILNKSQQSMRPPGGL